MISNGESSPGGFDASEADTGSAQLCYRGVQAEPTRFPALRRALTEWAASVGMSGKQVEALALATYEALSNTAEHAYPGGGGGVLDVEAVY